jgi:multidrug resistance efflux pump
MSQVFRQVSLERLSSPEQLDRLIKVTTPKGWIAMSTAAFLILISGVWSFTARIPQRVSSTGVVVAEDSVRQAFASITGQIGDLRVEVGDQVVKDQTLGTIETPNTDGTIEVAAIRSPATGHVVEILASTGEIVQPGEPIVTIEREIDPHELQVISYMSPPQAAVLREGMQVRVAPVSVNKEEYGYLVGEVEHIENYPASFQAVFASIENEEIAKLLTAASGGSPVLVRITLHEADTMSGLEWTDAKGPPTTLHDSTLSSVEVTVSEQRPISYILPFIK